MAFLNFLCVIVPAADSITPTHDRAIIEMEEKLHPKNDNFTLGSAIRFSF